MSQREVTARLVLERLREPNTIGVGAVSIKQSTLVTFGVPTALGVFLGTQLGLGLGAGAVGVFGFFLGALLYRATPEYLTAIQLVRLMIRYARKQRKIPNVADAAAVENDGLMAYFKTDESTRDKTHIEKFYPRLGVAERDDGAILAAVEWTPPNKDFDNSEDVFQDARQKSDVAASIDFPVQLFVTTDDFDIEGYFQQLERRKFDDDIKRNPVFRNVLDEITTRRRTSLQERGVGETRYFFVTRVTENEASVDSIGDESEADRLASTPVVGPLFSQLFGEKRTRTDYEEKRAMMQEAKQRFGKVEQMVAQEPDSDVNELTMPEFLRLYKIVWEGNAMDKEAVANQMRQAPAITGEQSEHTDHNPVEVGA